MPVRSTGVDWAVYQATGSVATLKRQGADFLIAKVTQDDGRDSFGARHIANARSSGLIPGAYHFLIEPGVGKASGYRRGAGATSSEAQARTFVTAAKAANGGTLDGLICCVDLEALNETSMDGTRRRIRSRPRAYHARAFAAEFHRLAPGRPLVIYTTASYLRGTDLRKWSQPMALWLAHWSMSSPNQVDSGHTGIPESRWTGRVGGIAPTIIQYQSGSHGGRAGGVSSDLCASNLTPAQLEAELTRPKADPVPELPDPDPDPSTVSTHRSLPSPAACLLAARTTLEAPLAALPAGTRVRGVRGRIGAWYQVGGSRSRLWLEVSALDGHQIRPPLWAPELLFTPLRR